MSSSVDLLFGTSNVRRRILAAFYATPGLVTHPRELARRLEHPSQVVGRELRRLEDAGILISETIGRVRRYRVNVDSPIAANVRGLVLRTIGAEALIGAAVGGVAGVEEAWIFGSHARGTERPSSDIDVLVIGRVDRMTLSERLVEVEQELGRDVNVVAYTRGELADLVSAGDPFVADVLAGPRTRITVTGDRLMRFRDIDELVALGQLEQKPPDPPRVRRWLDRSRSDLTLAGDVVAGVDRDRAMAIAYEAGFRACVGVLLLAGYRLASQPGHHRAAIEGAAAVLGGDARPLLRRIDGARQFRNEILYGDAPPASESQFAQLIDDVGELLTRLACSLDDFGG